MAGSPVLLVAFFINFSFSFAGAPGADHADIITPFGVDGNQQFAQGVGINIWGTNAPNTQLADTAVAPAGGDQPHNNMMPYLTLYFNIALQGVFPARP